jgi:hypothetical protein
MKATTKKRTKKATRRAPGAEAEPSEETLARGVLNVVGSHEICVTEFARRMIAFAAAASELGGVLDGDVTRMLIDAGLLLDAVQKSQWRRQRRRVARHAAARDARKVALS